MAGGLLDKLSPVSEDERLGCISVWSFDSINQLSEDDLVET